MNNGTNPPGDYHLLVPWFPILRRLRAAAPRDGGLAVVSFSVIVDAHGNPLKPYPSPDSRNLEPKLSAEDALAELLSALVENKEVKDEKETDSKF